MRNISARALEAFLSRDCNENVITLLKLYGANIDTPIYLADGYTKQLTSLSTDDDVAYGVTSEGIDHLFVPFAVTRPVTASCGSL